MNFYAVIVTLFLVGVFVEHADGVRLGTFNIQSLGDNKMARPHVVDVLQRVINFMKAHILRYNDHVFCETNINVNLQIFVVRAVMTALYSDSCF